MNEKVLEGLDASRRAAWAQKYAADKQVEILECYVAQLLWTVGEVAAALDAGDVGFARRSVEHRVEMFEAWDQSGRRHQIANAEKDYEEGRSIFESVSSMPRGESLWEVPAEAWEAA